jgi:hypothetical protein
VLHVGEVEVPELTRSANIKLNVRLSLRRYVSLITCPHGDLSKRRRDISAKDERPLRRHLLLILKGQVMNDKKHTHEARKAFRSSDKKAPLTEHEEKQRALLKNLNGGRPSGWRISRLGVPVP